VLRYWFAAMYFGEADSFTKALSLTRNSYRLEPRIHLPEGILLPLFRRDRFPFDQVPRYLLRDRDGPFGFDFS
jgi:hypothetical protein